MKKKIPLLLPLPFLLLSCSLNGPTSSSEAFSENQEPSSSSQENKLPLNEEKNLFAYHFPSHDRYTMPISAWCAPWSYGGVDHLNQEQYALVKESGLNVIYGLYENAESSLANVKKALQLCQDNDLVYMVRDSRIGVLSEETELLLKAIGELASYSSYGGALVSDEPGANRFQNLVPGRKAFRTHYSKYLYYANLFPNYATGEQLSGVPGGELDYPTYVENYLKTVQPQVLSFDYYGMTRDFPNVGGDYFGQLYLCSNLAEKYRVPFWPFIQACYYGGATRLPNEVDLRWQVGSNLVYGAKGIQYFNYMTPAETSGWIGNFVDKEGRKTSLYPVFQKINAQIASMDEVLMVSSRVAMMQFGDTPSPFPEAQKEEFVTSCRELSSVSTSSDLLIGVYDHGGKSAYYVFNNSLTERADLSLNFSSEVRANIYREEKKSEVFSQQLPLSLSPGESVLIDLLNY